jgi:hypothetical protein
LSTLPTSDKTSNAQYGYQVIAGFGVGINISTLIIMTPYSVEPRDKCELELSCGNKETPLTNAEQLLPWALSHNFASWEG